MTDIGNVWSIGGISIVVEKDSLDYPKLRVGLIDILDCSGAHVHYAGTEAYYRNVGFVLFDEFDTAIAPIIGSGSYEFVSDQGAEGNYTIVSATPTRLQALNYASPVYRVAANFRRSGV